MITSSTPAFANGAFALVPLSGKARLRVSVRHDGGPETQTARRQRNCRPASHNKTQNMKTKTPKEVIERERTAHHRALETLRAPTCSKSGLQLWRKVCEIERMAHAGATAYCNGEVIRLSWPLFGVREYDFRRDENAWESLRSVATDCVRNVFGHVPAGFFVNGDARGYALKLDPDAVTVPQGMYTDWGRNGILAARIDA